MKILWTHNWPDERKSMGPFMWTLLSGLRERGVNIDLHYIDTSENPYNIFKQYNNLKHVVKNYDLVHAQYGSLVGFITSKLNIPSVLSIRGSDWHRYTGKNHGEFIHSFLSHLLTAASINNYSEVIVMSKRMLNELEWTYKPKFSIIPDPIDLEKFYPRERSCCRQSFFNDDTKDYWVLFNTLSKNNPVKRLELAEKIVEKVRRTIPNVYMKVASGVDYNDMPFFINSCDLALCTSTHEGWPNSIKEALACGLPFVSTDVSDLKDIAIENDYCLVSNDVEILANGIINILNNIDNINRNKLFSSVKNMGIESAVDQILLVYQRAINNVID